MDKNTTTIILVILAIIAIVSVSYKVPNFYGALLTTPSFTDTNLTPGTTYYYVVTAVDSQGHESNYSVFITAQTLSVLTIPSAPTGLTGTPKSSDIISLSWAASSGATSYNIYETTCGTNLTACASLQFNKIGISTNTTFVHSGLNPNTIYYYQVSAVNSIGETVQTNHITVTTPANCTDIVWTPDTSSACPTTQLTQTSNCGNSRIINGNASCNNGCIDLSWTPDESTICSGTIFNQTSNCGSERKYLGTNTNVTACPAPAGNNTPIIIIGAVLMGIIIFARRKK